MNFFQNDSIVDVLVKSDSCSFDLADGRTITFPLEWFPRLAAADRKDKENWRLIGNGSGVHWPTIDEDISISGLLRGFD